MKSAENNYNRSRINKNSLLNKKLEKKRSDYEFDKSSINSSELNPSVSNKFKSWYFHAIGKHQINDSKFFDTRRSLDVKNL